MNSESNLPPKVVSECEELLAAAPRDPHPEALDAIRRMPKVVGDAFTASLPARFRARFMREAATAVLERASRGAPSSSRLAHAAHLFCMSEAGWLAASPWHLAGDSALKRCAALVSSGASLTEAVSVLIPAEATRLYIAASESDDRDSYLRAAAALIRRHKAVTAVLDGELIEWSNGDYGEAMRVTGLNAVHLAVADRAKASRHSVFSAQTGLSKYPVVVVDSTGRPMKFTDAGVELAVPEAPAAKASRPSAAREAQPADEPVPTPMPTVPSSAMQSRIQAMRATQAARRQAKP